MHAGDVLSLVFDICLLNRLYLRTGARHNHFNTFQFGTRFSNQPQELCYHNGDEQNKEEIVHRQETGVNL